jgi:hypothetical protein
LDRNIIRLFDANGLKQLEVVGLDGPRQAWGHPRPRGSAFGVLPGRSSPKRRGQRIISAERRCLILAWRLVVVCPTPDS